MYCRLLTSDGEFVAKFRLEPQKPFTALPMMQLFLWAQFHLLLNLY